MNRITKSKQKRVFGKTKNDLFIFISNFVESDIPTTMVKRKNEVVYSGGFILKTGINVIGLIEFELNDNGLRWEIKHKSDEDLVKIYYGYDFKVVWGLWERLFHGHPKSESIITKMNTMDSKWRYYFHNNSTQVK